MAKGLTKKQQARLAELEPQTLLDIVQQFANRDAGAHRWLVDGWLSDPQEVITRLNSRYNRVEKSTTFYDYRKADALFKQLINEFIPPLTDNVQTLPSQVEALAARMLLGFERLSERVDTSSGSWQDYTGALFDVWLSSVAAQTATRTAAESAQALFNVADAYDWFNPGALRPWRGALGSDVLRQLAALIEAKGHLRTATELLLIVGDIAAVNTALSHQQCPDVENILDLAALLIDELRTEEAIALLQKHQEASLRRGLLARWVTLMVSAQLEEGLSEQARKTALEAFSRLPQQAFWHLYLKAGGDEERDFSLFLRHIPEYDPVAGVAFLADTQHYALINDVITGRAPAEITIRLPDEISGSFWRSLSSTLFKQGHAQAAVILRRKLAEYAIVRANSQYYTYAANDAKKAIDYCAGLENHDDWLSSEAWLQQLYLTHFRKYSLWDVMQERITGLTINNAAGPVLSRKEP